MKKKIEKLRRDGRLEGNADFEALWLGYQEAESIFEKSKTDRKLAKSTFQFECDAKDFKGSEEEHRDKVFELEMAWQRADGERLIHRADFELAKYRLQRWVDAFARQAKAAPVAAKPARPKKAAAPRAKAKTPAVGGAPKPRKKVKVA